MRLILTPSQLWTPRPRGRIDLAALAPHEHPFRQPRTRAGVRFASGDTLAVFTPAANQPTQTNYAAIFVRNGHLVLAFDTTTQQTAVFAGVMPRNYTGGNVTVILSWMAASATSGTIGWSVSFERDNPANHDLDSDAWSTVVNITPVAVDATAGKVSKAGVNIAAGPAGTDSIAPGDPFRLRVQRDVANDTAAGDAHLLSVEIQET
jgi:hypothetical protein